MHFPLGPTLKLHVIEGEGGREGQASCLVYRLKQAVEFPQVLGSYSILSIHILGTKI